MFQLPDLLGLRHWNHAVTFGVVLEKGHEITPHLIITENEVLVTKSFREFRITPLLLLIGKLIFENFGEQ